MTQKHHLHAMLLTAFLLVACDKATKNSQWDNINYQGIARNQIRDYDADYVAPTQQTCLDDDSTGC